MATHSKAELLNWLKEPGRLLGNDMVFAIDKAKADTLLTQEYIRRFKTTSYLPPVNGETAADNGYKVYMQNFVLDHPRLSFDNVDITSSKASLRMKLVGGNQVDLKQAGAHWYPRRMDSIDPLVGPELSLKLELSDVPGYVDDDGRIMLDLRNSDNFVLNFSDSNRVRELGGDFFKEVFRALPVEKRVWSLGRIERGANAVLQPDSFRLRTQRDPASVFSPLISDTEADVHGAILGLVRMVGSLGDESIVPGPDYRYLIPSDSEAFSATVMLETRRLILATGIQQLLAAGLNEAAFSIVAQGEVLFARAVDGGLSVVDQNYSHSHNGGVPPGYSRELWVAVYLRSQDIRVAAAESPYFPGSGLQVTLEKDAVSMRWQVPLRVNVVLTNISDSLGLVDAQEYRDRHYAYSFNFSLLANWRVVDMALQLVNFSLSINLPYIDSSQSGADLVSSEGRNAYVRGVVTDAVSNGAERMIKEMLEPRLRAALMRDFSTSGAVNATADEVVKLSFNEKVSVSEFHAPYEIACFGHVNPRLTAFTITPLEKVITHSSKLQFATLPAQANVTWSAESVEGSSEAPGSFDKAVYQAPPASGIQGAFTRVRITATDPSTGYSASALVSVVKNALSLSPLVEVCQVGDTGVSLKAGHVGQGELRWKVLGAAPHGRLAHTTGQANTYIPGGNLTGKAFVVEQVEVSNSQTNEQRTLCVITQMTDMRPTDVVTVKQDAQAGRVWLALSLGSNVGVSELSVVHGPGKIGQDADGLHYQADSASSAPFCVVRVIWELMPGFLFEGFIVLPLPLAEHGAAYQTLEQAGQQAIRRLTGATA